MKSIYIVSKIVAREGEAKASPSKGIQSINLSDYLLKSVWDKVFEVRTDGQGTDYIFSKLPVVTQYGITMYSGDGVDIPSLASGLPFDGRTIWYNPNTNQIEVIGGTGGGSGEGVSNFWDLSGIPSWITISKPKYSYSEIEGTPDLSEYVTQDWIISQGYASAEELKKYIPISGYTEVSGEKNFTGGLKVNGSPIYYDTEKKYWKLEGDLLVTGGVTMYGVDSTDIPSLINSLPVATTKEKGVAYFDPNFFSVSSDGKVTFIGETGGGLDITALQNYLTQNSYLNVTEGDNRYLKLSGGTLTLENGDSFKIRRNKSNSYGAYIAYETNDGMLGRLGMYRDDIEVYFGSQTAKSYRLLHEGNYSNYALPLSGGVVKGVTTINGNSRTSAPLEIETPGMNYNGYIKFASSGTTSGYLGMGGIDKPVFRSSAAINYTLWHSGNDGADSGLDADLLDGKEGSWYIRNVLNFQEVNGTNTSGGYDLNVLNYGLVKNYASGSYWANAPTGMTYGMVLNLKSSLSNSSMGQLAWDVNHHGTDSTRYLYWRANDDRNFATAKWHQIAFTDSNVASATKLQTARTIWGQSFDGTADIENANITLYKNKSSYTKGWAFYINVRNSSNDILSEIGFHGGGETLTYTYIGGKWDSPKIAVLSNGNVGIGTASPAYKLDVNGSASINGNAYIGTSSSTTLTLMRGGYNYIKTPESGSLVFNMNGSSSGLATSSLYLGGSSVILGYNGAKVGIGVSPTCALHVSGDILATGGITTNDSVTINGIKLNKSKDGVLYLDGNLVVKGGVTMYGTDATSSPSIFDSLPIASTTTKGIAYFDSEFFSVGSDGKVTFIGKTDGFNATELQNYLTQNLYLNTTQGDNRYLKLSGGVIEGSSAEILSVNRTGGSNAYVSFRSDGSIIGYIGVSANQIPVFANRYGTATTIWHSGNDGVDSGLDADLLDGKEGSWYIRNVLNFQEVNGTYTSGGYDLNVLNYGLVKNYASTSYWANAPVGFSYGMVLNLKTSSSNSLLGQLAWDVNHNSTTDTTRSLHWRTIQNDTKTEYAKWHQIAFIDSNVESATKLQKARTIWGKSFDGTSDIDGIFRSISSDITSGSPFHKILAYPNSPYGLITRLYTNGEASLQAQRESDDSQTFNLILQPLGGNVGIGTPSPSYNLDVNGTFRCNSIVTDVGSPVALLNVKGIIATTDYIHLFVTGGTNKARPLVVQNGYGNVGIGVAAPTHKLHVVGNTYLNGDVFADELNTFDVLPRTNNAYSCGNSSLRWYQVYGNIGDFSGAVSMGSTLDVTGMTTMTNATITGNLRLKDSTNYGRAIYFGDGEYCYLEEASDDVLTIYANAGIKLNTSSTSYNVSINTNLLVSGGITMYSQRSLKNIQDERGLSLCELGAIKPIRYTWKDGRDNRIHFGGIADDIQQVLPEVVYKTNDGVLTMDYGNAAFAIASSLIQPVVDHEKRIAILEEENKQLRQEVERLKSA